MATRDLSYLITFDVSNTEEVERAATAMDTLDTSSENLEAGGATKTVDIEVGEGITNAPEQIDAVGTSLDGIDEPAGRAEDSLDVLGGVMTKVALGGLFVASAFEIGGRVIEIVTDLWDKYNARQQLTEEVTGAVTDALLEQSGAMAVITGELETMVEQAGTVGEVLNASIWQGIEAEQGAEEIGKIRTALLDLGLSFDDLGPTIVGIEDNSRAFLETLAEGAGIPADFADNVAEAVDSSESLDAIFAVLRDSNPELTAQFEDQIAALEQLNDAQQNVDYPSLIQGQLEAAESSAQLRDILSAVRTDLGPDASDLAVWEEYTNRLLEASGAAEGVDANLDGIEEPREANVELDQALADAEALKADMDLAAEDRETTIAADADTTQAAGDLLDVTAEDRTATIFSRAITEFAGIALDNLAADRTATIEADATNVGPVAAELGNLAMPGGEARVARINVATGTIDLPTASELAALIGPIRVPIDAYIRHVPRIDGNRYVAS